MQRFASVAVLAAGASASSGKTDTHSKANPLGQVLSLLGDLKAKVIKDGEAEVKAYKEYVEWCDDVITNGGFTIKTAESDKEKLEARIAEESAAIQAAETEIGTLAADLSTASADLKSATGIRDKESSEFLASEKELLEAIDALGRAIQILERKMKQNPASLAQVKAQGLQGVVQSLSAIVDAASFSVNDKNRLMALVQSQQGDGDSSGDDALDGELGAPAAAAYKTHSGSIFDVLEDLKEKAESQLSDLRKAEVSAKHNYEMLKQSLDDQMSADNKDMSTQKNNKASASEAKAVAEGDLAVTVEDLKTAKEAKETAQKTCMQVAGDHEQTVAAREAELKVIDEATKILQETSSGAVDQTYSLLQTDTGAKIFSNQDLARSEVVALLKKLAKEHHSAALAQLASRVAAVERYGGGNGEDPFAKVKQMIQDMISKLQSEASSESTEKSYCDGELAKTEEKKGELNQDNEKLTSKIDQASSRSAGLKADVKELQAELANSAKEFSENEKWRQEAHSDYVQAKGDLELGLSGVRKALVVLRDYYAQESSAAMSLIQQPEMPEHNKATGSGTSIIGILEVVESDFAENLAKEETEEATAVEAHEKWVMEYKLFKTKAEQDVKYKTQEHTGLDKSISELSSDLQTSNSELAAVMDYYGSLRERCIAKPETYEERKARREAEISGLKEALSILEGDAVFTQRSGFSRRHLRGADSGVLAPEN